MHQLGIIEYCVATKYANLFGVAALKSLTLSLSPSLSHVEMNESLYANAEAAADTMHKLNNVKRIGGNKRDQSMCVCLCVQCALANQHTCVLLTS